ncbi:hypothetical protein DFH09DRAFT_1081861 [Mycena vulgaris]|nr:hypothetical protein DFH09DRAFT_1081861 [Mycena vulgaris]
MPPALPHSRFTRHWRKTRPPADKRAVAHVPLASASCGTAFEATPVHVILSPTLIEPIFATCADLLLPRVGGTPITRTRGYAARGRVLRLFLHCLPSQIAQIPSSCLPAIPCRGTSGILAASVTVARKLYRLNLNSKFTSNIKNTSVCDFLNRNSAASHQQSQCQPQ